MLSCSRKQPARATCHGGIRHACSSKESAVSAEPRCITLQGLQEVVVLYGVTSGDSKDAVRHTTRLLAANLFKVAPSNLSGLEPKSQNDDVSLPMCGVQTADLGDGTTLSSSLCSHTQCRSISTQARTKKINASCGTNSFGKSHLQPHTATSKEVCVPCHTEQLGLTRHQLQVVGAQLVWSKVAFT
jgi:hypothetical protein